MRARVVRGEPHRALRLLDRALVARAHQHERELDTAPPVVRMMRDVAVEDRAHRVRLAFRRAPRVQRMQGARMRRRQVEQREQQRLVVRRRLQRAGDDRLQPVQRRGVGDRPRIERAAPCRAQAGAAGTEPRTAGHETFTRGNRSVPHHVRADAAVIRGAGQAGGLTPRRPADEAPGHARR